MARYEHLPIYRAAFDLAVHIEKLVRGFTRYHKYSLGSELREQSREILARIIDANHSRDRAARLLQLRGDLENFKVMVRLCHESGGFASARSYLYVAEQVVEISRQNEGWLRQTMKARESGAERDRSGEAGSGQNWAG